MLKALQLRDIIRVLLLSLFCSAATSAQTGLFKGRIVNASHDSIGIAGKEIALQWFKEGLREPMHVAAARSAAGGRFEFRIAAVDTSAHYLVSSDHQGVRYYSKPVHLHKSAGAVLDIAVFDSTRSNRQVRGTMHHLFAQNTGKSLAVRESRILTNPSTKTIVHAIADGHEKEAILRFVLPTTAQNITPISGRDAGELTVHGHIVYDNGVFEPGSRQISYAYEIPWKYDEAALEVDFPQPTRAFDVFVADAGITLQGDRLIDHGPFNIRGINYQRYGLQEVESGSRIRVRFTRQSGAAEEDSPALLIISTITLLTAGLLAAAARRNRGTPAISGEMRNRLLQNRKTLIREIAALDLKADADAESLQKRQEMFEQLQNIERMLHPGRAGQKTTKK